MATVHDIAELTSERLGAVIDRARPVARGVALLASACGGLAYVVGCLVIHGVWRYVWIVGGLVLCAAPAWALWLAFRRLRRANAALPTTVRQLQSLRGDREVRNALYEIVETDHDSQTTPLVTLGKDLNRLRKAVSGHREQLSGLWETISAITTLPGLMALGIVGSFGLLIFSVVAVLVGLALR